MHSKTRTRGDRRSRHTAVVRRVASMHRLSVAHAEALLETYWLELISRAWADGRVTVPGIGYLSTRYVASRPSTFGGSTPASTKLQVRLRREWAKRPAI